MSFNTAELVKRWTALSMRERYLLVLGLAVLLLGIGYAMIYAPLQVENHRLRQQLQAQEQIRQHLQYVSERVSALRASNNEAPLAGGEPGQVIADSSRQLDLQAYVQMQQAADGQVDIAVQNMPFNELVYWLAVLQQQHAISLIAIDIQQTGAETGLVNGRLTLGGALPGS
ncbi:MAG: hypothetical protein CTY19_17035 [Methylomonas sp.]|nr:MAG: hypothetical protein CTY19_17035 [Methylomonas sp.]